MSQRRPYRMVNVKEVNVARIAAEREGAPVWVGVDIGSETIAVSLCWGDKDFSRSWRVSNPGQVRLLVQKLKQLSVGRKLIVALEPTGTYGDPLRYRLGEAGLEVHRVQAKASHDYAEVFDSTPSQHDSKDGQVVAELARIGKSEPWPLERMAEQAGRMKSLVKLADDQHRALSLWSGRIESWLARHWPEATGILELTSATLLRSLAQYRGPSGLAEDAEAPGQLRQWGRDFLSEEKIEGLIASARATVGVPATEAEAEQVAYYASKALEARGDLEKTKNSMAKMTVGHEVLEGMAEAVGPATAVVLFVLLGDPRKYHCAEAYVKAAGLNLAERSSGKYIGELKISKRGPGMARKWLFLAAARMLAEPKVRKWFDRKRERDLAVAASHRRKGIGMKGLVGVMRRQLTGMWKATKKGTKFDGSRLFGGRGAGPAAGALPECTGVEVCENE